MEAELLIQLVSAMDRIERKLDALENSQVESQWLDSKEFCKLAGISSPANLQMMVRRGKIHGDAIRNVGTAKRQHLRYHRVKAMNQYLKKVPSSNL